MYKCAGNQSKIARTYIKAGALTIRLFSYAPLLLLYISQLYMVLAVFYVLSRPELVVSACFGVIDAIPNYAEYAFDRIKTQFAHELDRRFR